MTNRTRSNPSSAVSDGAGLNDSDGDGLDVVSEVANVGAGCDAVPAVEHPANGIVLTSIAMAAARHDMV
ncbi:MAG: hypothetical protein H0U86_01620 [Chloroflexi bacterium]|nr:hypothetical protein [Chloroflexota bacterium]